MNWRDFWGKSPKRCLWPQIYMILIYLQTLSPNVVRRVPSWPLFARSKKCNQFIDSILEDMWFSLFLYL